METGNLGRRPLQSPMLARGGKSQIERRQSSNSRYALEVEHTGTVAELNVLWDGTRMYMSSQQFHSEVCALPKHLYE